MLILTPSALAAVALRWKQFMPALSFCSAMLRKIAMPITSTTSTPIRMFRVSFFLPYCLLISVSSCFE